MILSSLPSIRTGTRLVVIDGPVHGRQFSLGRQLTTIGRSIGCHVTVESDDVAYDHARIVRTPVGWNIEPIGELAALWVNDEPIGDARPLRSGDLIRVGPARLRFESTGQAG
jgi:pSer/pThr/pTyr-binding forkhead associated (FHA) protein